MLRYFRFARIGSGDKHLTKISPNGIDKSKYSISKTIKQEHRIKKFCYPDKGIIASHL